MPLCAHAALMCTQKSAFTIWVKNGRHINAFNIVCRKSIVSSMWNWLPCLWPGSNDCMVRLELVIAVRHLPYFIVSKLLRLLFWLHQKNDPEKILLIHQFILLVIYRGPISKQLKLRAKSGMNTMEVKLPAAIIYLMHCNMPTNCATGSYYKYLSGFILMIFQKISFYYSLGSSWAA